MVMKHAAIVSTLVLVLLAGCSPSPPNDGLAEGDAPARNVILFIGDGMGVSTVTAARIFDGQSQGLSGEEHSLAFDRFPQVALVKTYETNQQTADSAGTATAMMTGHKTRAGVINVGPAPNRQDCEGGLRNALEPLGVMAKRRGLAVGVVTTTRITHATPAAVYAQTPERDWESDRYLTEEDAALGCVDIATQLVSLAAGGGLDLALGGGREMFRGTGGERKDPDADLAREWREAAPGRRYLETAAGLDAIAPREQVL